MNRKSLYELIENASQQQKQELAWVGNLFRKRIKDLMETKVKYDAWFKAKQTQSNENKTSNQ